MLETLKIYFLFFFSLTASHAAGVLNAGHHFHGAVVGVVEELEAPPRSGRRVDPVGQERVALLLEKTAAKAAQNRTRSPIQLGNNCDIANICVNRYVEV